MSSDAAGRPEAKWAGDFSCSTCGRKRLIAADFSKKQLEKRSKDLSASIKCKQCVESEAQTERAEAAARAAQKAATANGSPMDVSDPAADAATSSSSEEMLMCSSCKLSLRAGAFSRAQTFKGDKRRCLECVSKAEQSEASAASARRDEELEAARKALKEVEAKGGSALEVAKAFAKVSALEGQKVTGLKPVVLGRGRGRAAGRGAAAARGGKGGGSAGGRGA